MSGAREDRKEQDRGAAYAAPILKRLGSATELTQQRAMAGEMDGGANNSRTG
jgi:hypothetical protein